MDVDPVASSTNLQREALKLNSGNDLMTLKVKMEKKILAASMSLDCDCALPLDLWQFTSCH